MKQSILLILIALTILTSCGDSGTPFKERKKTPEELRMELVESEKMSPLTYLSVSSKMRQDQKMVRPAGLFRGAEYAPDGATIFGTIKNTATIAKFKDVVLSVSYYSQTQTKIETKEFILYEFYKPNSTNSFELKVYPPQAMKNFQVEIRGATAAD